MKRHEIIKALKFHVRQWNFETEEIRGNFQNTGPVYMGTVTEI
jgi:hypothetical protein